MTRAGNVIPMRELVDTRPARASGVAPAKAWAMLDLARAAGYADARLTWCAGWTSALRDDPGKPLTAAGKPGRSATDVVTQSLALRVPGLLWCAWERPDGAASWAPPSPKTQGQIKTIDGRGVARVATCTVAAVEKVLRAAVKTRGATDR
jgi:hypothetical protein